VGREEAGGLNLPDTIIGSAVRGTFNDPTGYINYRTQHDWQRDHCEYIPVADLIQLKVNKPQWKSD